jgi:MFS family permease
MVVGVIFVTMFFIWGAINSGAVFFVPILKSFGWSRARLSVAFSVGWVTGGAAGPLIGWLADRINPKKMMTAGAVITGLLWFALSRATSFGEFLAINGMFGICVGASTVIPCSLLIANWFQHRRGLAMGIAFSGMTLGGATMTMVANHAIATGGWRVGYATLAAPIVFIVVPLILLVVRTRDSSEAHPSDESLGEPQAVTGSTPAIELPGLELAEAVRVRSFWLISAAQLFAGISIGMAPHFIAYLTGIGYTATFAATIVSLFLLATTAGTLLGGPLADRLGARQAMTATFVLSALGMLGLLGASHPLGLAANIVAGGFAAGAFAVQNPLVMIESIGIRRLGSVMGITGVFYTFGAALSPIVTGRIFDLTGSYSIPISSFVVMYIICSIAILGCRPLDLGQLQVEMPARSVAV